MEEGRVGEGEVQTPARGWNFERATGRQGTEETTEGANLEGKEVCKGTGVNWGI